MSTDAGSYRADAEVIVIGGGAMGSAATWQLVRRGYRVMQLERFEPGHVRGSSHGRSRVFRLSYPDPLYAGLARQALAEWRRLEDEAGVSLLTVTGGVDHGDPAYVDRIAQALRQTAVPFDLMTPEAAQQAWPGLRFDQQVLYQRDAGRIHADRTIQALQDAATARGAVVRHNAPVRRLQVNETGVRVSLDDETLHAPQVVVAAGSWAAKLLADVVELPKLVVSQQQPAHFQPRSEGDPWPSFLHYGMRTHGHHGYGLLTPGEGVKVWVSGTGVTVDPDTRDRAPNEPAMARLIDYAKTWVPGVDPRTAIPISCLYTSTANTDFILDRVGPMTIGAGCSGHAFKFTPLIGRILADLVAGKPAPSRRFGLTGRRPSAAPGQVIEEARSDA